MIKIVVEERLDWGPLSMETTISHLACVRHEGEWETPLEAGGHLAAGRALEEGSRLRHRKYHQVSHGMDFCGHQMLEPGGKLSGKDKRALAEALVRVSQNAPRPGFCSSP